MFGSLSLKITAYCAIFCEQFLYFLYMLPTSLTCRGRPGPDGCLARFVYNFLKCASILAVLISRGTNTVRQLTDMKESVYLRLTVNSSMFLLPRLRLSGRPFTLPVSFSSIYQCQYWMVSRSSLFIFENLPNIVSRIWRHRAN